MTNVDKRHLRAHCPALNLLPFGRKLSRLHKHKIRPHS
jgi:hypothetical protein